MLLQIFFSFHHLHNDNIDICSRGFEMAACVLCHVWYVSNEKLSENVVYIDVKTSERIM
jgi:hypothetical protein